jgi:hypothetical protein
VYIDHSMHARYSPVQCNGRLHFPIESTCINGRPVELKIGSNQSEISHNESLHD